MKKYTFFVMSNNGTSMKQFSVSKNLVLLSFLMILVLALALSYFGRDYMHLKKEYVSSSSLEETIRNQDDLISGQKKQISNFAQEINTLKKNLVELKLFEKKIRIIANIEKETSGGDSLFGVGGSIPGDLDPLDSSSVSQDHLMREMHQVVETLEGSAQKQEEDFDSLLKYLEDQRNLLASTPAIWPAKGYITSKFGYRVSPFTGKKEFHKGLDIANRKGVPVLATADGIITFSGRKGLLGLAVVIDHGHGLVTRYGHLNKLLMKKGTRVKRGDVVAEMGNTGRSTGPHVHYEVRLNGIPVNPKKYILN